MKNKDQKILQNWIDTLQGISVRGMDSKSRLEARLLKKAWLEESKKIENKIPDQDPAFYQNIKDALKIDGIEINNLSIDGGMAANSSFCQLLADFLGQEVQVPSSLESTATGAAITAGLGSNFFSIADLHAKQSTDSTTYKPRDEIFEPKDLTEWRKFLSVLLNAYN